MVKLRFSVRVSNGIMNMKGKNILVVGGTGGIGSDVVRTFIDQGARVFATYYNEQEMEALKPTLEQGTCNFVFMDVRDERSVSDAFSAIQQEAGRIDVLVFAPTAPTKHGRIDMKTWEAFQEHIHVQIKGFFCVMQKLMPQIKQKQPVKVVVLSTEYCIGKPPTGISDYVTAKYGLLGLSKCMATEVARYGSTVNIVSPGMVETPLLETVPSVFKELSADQNPLGRIAIPKDVTSAILFLASDSAGYLNGANITVNGGGVMI